MPVATGHADCEDRLGEAPDALRRDQRLLGKPRVPDMWMTHQYRRWNDAARRPTIRPEEEQPMGFTADAGAGKVTA